MILRWVILAACAMALVMAVQEPEYYTHHEPSYWQGFKNALSDINPFSSKLGHDWADTQYKVEDIYRDTHLEAQRKVAELKEDSMKDSKELQKKIADIYLQAASDAEKRIERLKRPIFASIWRSGSDGEHDENEYPTHGGARHMYDRAKEAVDGAADRVRKKWSPHEEVNMFDDASKKIRDTYQSAVNKAKDVVSQVPTVGEAWHDTKQRTARAYDDIFHGSHAESRSTFQKFRDSLGRGMHTVGGTAGNVAWKTWHLVLHLFIGAFWLALGALSYGGIKWWIEKQTFKKQLAAPVQGPVVLSKVFTVFGTEDTQRKFQEYWTNVAAGFFSRQPGLRKFSLQRGIDVGSNMWCHLSEWNSIEDLRRCVNQPEIAELKKRMPKGVMSKRCVSQVVSTGKATGAAVTEGEARTEGNLRQRGGPSS